MNTRARIDPITNVIRPRALNIARYGDFKKGYFPEEIIIPFVHEFTHHWCLDSNLGLTLALKRFRAYRTLLTPVDTEVKTWQLFEDVAVVDFVIKLLTPLFEGLALFAEFDIRPGQSKVYSPPLFWLSIALKNKPGKNGFDYFETLNPLLSALRTIPYTINRKENILTTPIFKKHQRDADIYYSGYVIVKRLYEDLSKKVSLLEDKDFFFSFLRAYIFEDLVLVQLICDSFKSTPARIVAIVECFQQRILDLYKKDWSVEAQLLENTLNKPEAKRDGHFLPGGGRSKSESERGAELITNLVEELNQQHSENIQVNDVLRLQREFINRRHIVNVSTERVLIKVLKGRLTVWADSQSSNFTFNGQALNGVQDTNEIVTGWVSYILLPMILYHGMVVGLGDQIVHVSEQKGADMDAVYGWVKHLRDPKFEHELGDAVTEWVNGYLKEAEPPLRDIIDAYNQTILNSERALKDFFFRKFSYNAPGNLLEYPQMLRGIFKELPKLFDTYILASLLDIDLEKLCASKELKDMGYDVRELLNFLYDLSKNRGLSLLTLNEYDEIKLAI